jgi:dGTP triphosphohydrolase
LVPSINKKMDEKKVVTENIELIGKRYYVNEIQKYETIDVSSFNYQKDINKIMFSQFFRRLGDKTQVNFSFI